MALKQTAHSRSSRTLLDTTTFGFRGCWYDHQEVQQYLAPHSLGNQKPPSRNHQYKQLCHHQGLEIIWSCHEKDEYFHLYNLLFNKGNEGYTLSVKTVLCASYCWYY